LTLTLFPSGGVHTLRLDGSVRFVADSTDADLWKAVATRSGGEVVAAE
jgi:allantoicase